MDQTSITAAGAIDTFLVLFIGIEPKLALVPFVEITALLDAATKRRVERKMLVTAGTVALILMLLGELLRALLHFTIGSRSIAGGVTLLVLAEEETGDLLFQGWTVTDPQILAEVAQHSPVADNESVVRFPARMRAMILEALNGQGAAIRRADSRHDELGRAPGDARRVHA